MKRQLFAEWWQCPEEACNCYQPVIMERSDGNFWDDDWRKPERVASGPSRSSPTRDDWETMNEWMKWAKKEHRIPEPKS